MTTSQEIVNQQTENARGVHSQVFREDIGAGRAGCVSVGLEAALKTGCRLAEAFWNARGVGEHPTAGGLLDPKRLLVRQVLEVEPLGLAARMLGSGHVGN